MRCVKCFYRFFVAANPINLSATADFSFWQLTQGEFPVIAKCLCVAESSNVLQQGSAAQTSSSCMFFYSSARALPHMSSVCLCLYSLTRFCCTDFFKLHVFLLFSKGSTTHVFCLLVFIFFNKVLLYRLLQFLLAFLCFNRASVTLLQFVSL